MTRKYKRKKRKGYDEKKIKTEKKKLQGKNKVTIKTKSNKWGKKDKREKNHKIVKTDVKIKKSEWERNIYGNDRGANVLFGDK